MKKLIPLIILFFTCVALISSCCGRPLKDSNTAGAIKDITKYTRAELAISAEFLKETHNIIKQEIAVAVKVPEGIAYYLKSEIKEIDPLKRWLITSIRLEIANALEIHT